MATNPPQLFLLADHIKLSLLERHRAVSLNLPCTSQDAHISRSLEQLRAGIESLESQVQDTSDDAISSQLPRLRHQLADLTSQFQPSTTPPSPTPHQPHDPSLAPATKKPRPANKSVRFSDAAPAAPDDPNRAALFPYRDNPDPDAAPDHSALDNQQIHAYHSQVIREQDAQLDQLGLSIGRQRELSMQIGDELDGQGVLLDEFDGDVDRHADQFRRARDRLDRFSRNARENWSMWVIVVLIVVLVLLIVITK